MKITALDHLVLTVANIEKSIAFYTQVLGMEEITFGEGRKALLFGRQKINLHQRGAEVLPNAQNAACGTADLCLLTDTPMAEQITADEARALVDAMLALGAKSVDSEVSRASLELKVLIEQMREQVQNVE